MNHDPMTSARDDASLPCREQDAELWWSETPGDVAQAKAACIGCPIRSACLTGALDRHEPAGVWGGELLKRGVIVQRARPKPPRACDWCHGPIPPELRADAECCSVNCRKIRHRTRVAAARAREAA